MKIFSKAPISNQEIITQIICNSLLLLRHVGRYYVTLLLNRELVTREKLCLVHRHYQRLS